VYQAQLSALPLEGHGSDSSGSKDTKKVRNPKKKTRPKDHPPTRISFPLSLPLSLSASVSTQESFSSDDRQGEATEDEAETEWEDWDTELGIDQTPSKLSDLLLPSLVPSTLLSLS